MYYYVQLYTTTAKCILNITHITYNIYNNIFRSPTIMGCYTHKQRCEFF